MLDEFILSNRDAIIARTQERVASRTPQKPGDVRLTSGAPAFVEQLGDALRSAKGSDAINLDQIGESAGQYGQDVLGAGLPIAQVVHEYGDVYQAITELAIEQGASTSADELRTLNLCRDHAIAAAVTSYSSQRERALSDQGAERLGVLAHELRNLLNVATFSFETIKGGHAALDGSIGLMHSRSLRGLQNLIDRSLAAVRLGAGIEHRESIPVAELVAEVEIGTLFQAEARDLHFTVAPVDPAVTIEGDRQIVASVISNLLHNAFKFTRKNGNVSLTVRATEGRVLFEVEDECRGLPPGNIEDLFRPFAQRGSDRRSVGLGLFICRQAARANGGEIHVRELPGKGCVFILDLPRQLPPASPVVASAPGE